MTTKDIQKTKQVSHRRQKADAARESDALLRVIFDQAFQMMGLMKPDGTVLKINQTAYAFINGKESDVFGRLFWETPWWSHSPEQQEKLKQAVKTAAGGEFVRFETTHQTTAGKLVYIDFTITPVKDEKGDVIFLVPEGRDITERKNTENALRESEWKFRAVFDQNFQLMGLLRLDGTLINANRTALELSGASESDVRGKPFWETPWWAHSKELRHAVREAVKRAAQGEIVSFEASTPAADGAFHFIEFSIKPVKDETGKVVLLVPEARDITERKRAENALRESEWKFRAIFDQHFQLMGLLSPDGTAISANRTALRLSGVSEADFKGKPFWETPWWAHSKELQNEVREAVRRAARGEHVSFEATHPAVDGTLHYIEFSLKPVTDEMGNIVLLVPEGRDITESKRAEAEIRQLNQDLEARVAERTRELELANRELEAFTYSVSHDLRAPLRAIDGFSTALLEDYADKLDGEAKTYLGYLQEGSHEMSNLIDGLLNLSRSTRGELSVERIDLSAMADEVVKELRTSEPGRLVSILIAPCMKASADHRLLRVVLENLLGNAWKYTSRNSAGRIEFSCEVQKEETVYCVRDNGAGFDMAYAGKLFLPFQRLHKTTEFAGIGIGLATVERIIHHHNGRIWAQGAVGAGATFYFTLGQKGDHHGKSHNTSGGGQPQG